MSSHQFSFMFLEAFTDSTPTYQKTEIPAVWVDDRQRLA
ncbi:hypothetical protein PENSTE_c014G04224 [Penicillium steckii]|uniref:Uncharacterized protein n=1 Tax=Penicillium steckii TaxID=303698 RepID=A0A1V6T246_9EURO|nr:hypothetical protein PENSTE_c014G04224 [Penicillium steckii]